MPSDRTIASAKRASRLVAKAREELEKSRKALPSTSLLGVDVDILDLPEVGDMGSKGVKKLLPKKKTPTPRSSTTPSRTVLLKPSQVPKGKLTTRAAKTAFNLAKVGGSKVPLLGAPIMAYEGLALANSPEAQQEARDKFQEMGERGNTVAGAAQNAVQGFLDPVNTLYAVGDALGDIASVRSKQLYHHLFGRPEIRSSRLGIKR